MGWWVPQRRSLKGKTSCGPVGSVGERKTLFDLLTAPLAHIEAFAFAVCESSLVRRPNLKFLCVLQGESCSPEHCSRQIPAPPAASLIQGALEIQALV